MGRPVKNRLLRSTLLVATFFAVDKALALVRQVLVARRFGVSPELDAFNAANNLPDLLFTLISGGALAVAFIPILSEHLERDDRAGLWQLFSQVANLAFLVTAALAVVIAALAQPLVGWKLGVAPGFDAERQALVVSLMRLNLVATLIFSVSGLAMAGLHAHQHFLLPALAPLLYNVGQIIGVVFLAPSGSVVLGPLQLPTAGLGVTGLVVGVIGGAALHLGVQVPGLLRYGFRWVPWLDWTHPGLRRVLRLMGPRVLTLGAVQVVFLATDNLASRLAPGSVSALAYGWWIMQVPETVIGTAIGLTLLPTLAELHARGDRAGVRQALEGALRMTLALTVPITVVLMVLIRPLVQAVFNFDARATELVVAAAQAMLLGLAGHSLLEVAARAYYARQDARTPLVAACGSAAVFVGAAVLGSRAFGPAGIALANALAFTLQALALLALLARRERDLESRPVSDGAWRVAGATAVMGLALAAFVWLGGRLEAPVRILGGGLLAMAVYGAAAWGMNLREVREIRAVILGRVD